MNLLEKTRKINSMLQASAGKPVNFKEMADTLGDIIDSNVYILSRKGKLLGISIHQQIENERMKKCSKRDSSQKNTHIACLRSLKHHQI